MLATPAHADAQHVVEIDHAQHLQLPAAAWFIGHGQITNRALIEAACLTSRPLLLDTSGATLKEVMRAVGWCQLVFRAGNQPRVAGLSLAGGARVCLLHGVLGSAPLRLRAMTRMQELAHLPVGLIDTSPQGVGPVALALGASVLVRAAPGLSQYAASVQAAQADLGPATKIPDGAEVAAVHAARQRIVAARDLEAGAVLSTADIALESPGPDDGQFAPFHAEAVIGRQLARSLKRGEPVAAADLAGQEAQEPAWFAPRPPRTPPVN